MAMVVPKTVMTVCRNVSLTSKPTSSGNMSHLRGETRSQGGARIGPGCVSVPWLGLGLKVDVSVGVWTEVSDRGKASRLTSPGDFALSLTLTLTLSTSPGNFACVRGDRMHPAARDWASQILKLPTRVRVSRNRVVRRA